MGAPMLSLCGIIDLPYRLPVVYEYHIVYLQLRVYGTKTRLRGLIFWFWTTMMPREVQIFRNSEMHAVFRSANK